MNSKWVDRKRYQTRGQKDEDQRVRVRSIKTTAFRYAIDFATLTSDPVWNRVQSG